MKKQLFILLLFVLAIVSTGCSTKEEFVRGDIKDDFCGLGIDARYCKCAFHNDFCDGIGMSKKEAKKHVNEKYDEWADEELQKWQDKCENDGGILHGEMCEYCDEGFIAQDGDCMPVDEIEEDVVESEEDEGDCKYDSDCDPICEGNVKWKMGCNARSNTCEKTFEKNCSEINDSFVDLSFSQICVTGECVRDDESIQKEKQVLIEEQKMWSDAVKEINKFRQEANVVMLEANKNCINGIADMTNVAIIEFATRVGSILAGGIPDIAKMIQSAAEHAAGLATENIKNLAGSAVDYVGEAVNRLGNYAQGEPAEEDKKLKPHEYIKLNCDLYEYFKQEIAATDSELETALEKANYTKSLIDALP